MQSEDRAVRAMTNDGSFRVIALHTTAMIAEAITKQPLDVAQAGLYGELLTGAVLVRQTMAPSHRVQVILREQARSSRQMVADSFPEGLTRGVVHDAAAADAGDLSSSSGDETEHAPPPRPFSITSESILQVVRVLYNNEIHQGFVNAPERGGISPGADRVHARQRAGRQRDRRGGLAR